MILNLYDWSFLDHQLCTPLYVAKYKYTQYLPPKFRNVVCSMEVEHWLEMVMVIVFSDQMKAKNQHWLHIYYTWYFHYWWFSRGVKKCKNLNKSQFSLSLFLKPLVMTQYLMISFGKKLRYSVLSIKRTGLLRKDIGVGIVQKIVIYSSFKKPKHPYVI